MTSTVSKAANKLRRMQVTIHRKDEVIVNFMESSSFSWRESQ